MVWKILIWTVGLLVLAGMVWIRLSPTKPDDWHEDPLAAEPGPGRFVVKPEGGDTSFGPVPEAADTLLFELDKIAMATPRTKRLVGTPSEGQVTYITRSKTIGFPDFTTVKAIPGPDGTRLAVFARLRFGREDFGVNRARVEGWLDALAQPRG